MWAYGLLASIAPFAVIIALVRLRVDLGLAVLAGALLMTALLNPFKILELLIITVTDWRTLYLISMSFTVSMLAELYGVTGLIKDLGLGIARALGRTSLALMIVPAMVALLPVAGGALMSAPIVEGVGSTAGLGTALMVFTNLWFRHIVFLSYPLSQMMITASAMTGVPIDRIAAYQSPILAFAVLIGYLIIRRGVRGGGSAEVPKPLKPLKITLTPLVVAVALALTLREVLGPFGMPLGVLLGSITISALSGNPVNSLRKALTSKSVWGITLTAYAIMLLQHSTVVSGASRIIAEALAGTHAPAEALYICVPAAIAVLTGSPLSGVVLSISMLPSAASSLSTLSLMYASALLTYIPSPTHLCLIYTAKYFRVKRFSGVYALLITAIALTLTFAALYTYLLKYPS